MEKNLSDESTDTVKEFFSNSEDNGILLVAHSPINSAAIDRHTVENRLAIGRPTGNKKNDINFKILDSTLSKRHFVIEREQNNYLLSDMGSSNGVYLNGLRLTSQKKPLEANDLVRAGNCLFVFHADSRHLLKPPSDRMGIVGSFHTEKLLENLKEAALSSHPILLAGPSGAGKDLSARALAKTMGLELHTYNAAMLPGNDVAVVDLFGVQSGIFSGISSRPGLVEHADGGALFINEVHNLPPERQRSLLLIIEEKKYARIGEPQAKRDVDIRFIFASNEPSPGYGLIHDFLNRQRVTNIPPLSEIKADIPAIFNYWLQKYLEQHELNPDKIFKELITVYYEILCTDGLRKDNVRGLKDLADRIATSCALNKEPDQAIKEIFMEHFADNIVVERMLSNEENPKPKPKPKPKHVSSTEGIDESRINLSVYYEQRRQIITETYLKCDGSIAATQRILKTKHNIKATRASLGKYIHHSWKLPHKKELKQSGTDQKDESNKK